MAKLTATDFDRFRRNIEHEDNLVNHRTSWMLTSQSFLLGACIAYGKYPFVARVVGTIVAIASGISTHAAITAIGKASSDFEEKRDAAGGVDGVVPDLISAPPWHSLGLVAPRVLHGLFAVVWWFPPATMFKVNTVVALEQCVFVVYLAALVLLGVWLVVVFMWGILVAWRRMTGKGKK